MPAWICKVFMIFHAVCLQAADKEFGMDNRKFIFVTGFFGAPLDEIAGRLAEDEGAELISLDEEISRDDGRSILRICMLMGEHEYRNKEYEALQRLTASAASAGDSSTADSGDGAKTTVVLCSDGVLHDDMSAEIIKNHDLVIAGRDMDRDELWQNASAADSSYHAFMTLPDESARRRAFDELYERQLQLFSRF